MTNLVRGAGRGLAAGAAATTALNAVTYLDMAIRGRPASSTPEKSVEKLADVAGVTIPGEGEERDNRVAGLAPLLGSAAGLAAGVTLGLVRAAGLAPGPVAATAVAFGTVMVAGNAPMTVLGITDPRSWSAGEWAADIAPHAAYAVVAAGVLAALDARRGR